MRLSLLVFSLLFMPSAFGPAQATPQQPATGPTLEDTASWISSNLIGVHEAHQRISETLDPKTHIPKPKSRQVYQYDTVILQAHVDRCQLLVIEKENTQAPNWPSTETRIYAVPLDRMQSAELTTVDRSKGESGSRINTYVPVTYTVIRVTADREVVKWSAKTIESPGDTTSDQGVSKYWGFGTDDSALAQRLSKALSHAVDLCHASAKPEPF